MNADPQKPNILLIMTDQHRLSAVGAYGETPCLTPSIDALATSGVRFENAYTPCPVCTPARASIMTGLYPHAHGMTSNPHQLGSCVHELADHPELLSRRLCQADYRCGLTGKWHLGGTEGDGGHAQRKAFSVPYEVRGSLPSDVGFEGQYFPGPKGGSGYHYPEYREYLARQGFEHKVHNVRPELQKVTDYGILEGPEESTLPFFLAEHTRQLVDRFASGDEPFFIWHNFFGPHFPMYAPQEFYDLYRDVEIPPWPSYHWAEASMPGPHQVTRHPDAARLPWEAWAEAIRHYYAFATLIDRQIGRIVAHLEAKDLLENTIVIVTADHGDTLGSHGGLANKGFTHFEEIQRVPLVIRLPEHLAARSRERGETMGELVSLVDLYPTLLDFAGVCCEQEEVHGRSLRPLLANQPIAWREQVLVEFFGVRRLPLTLLTVRKGHLKYGWNPYGRHELYDLQEDPHELSNRIDDSQYRTATDELQQVLLTSLDDTDFEAKQVKRSMGAS